MPDKQYDFTSYKLDLTPTYKAMKKAKREIAYEAQMGATPEGIVNRTAAARKAVFDAMRRDAGATVLKCQSRMTDIEKSFAKQPVSSFGLDVRTHKLQTARDHAGALADNQLAAHIGGLLKDPASMDTEIAAIYGAEARRRGLQDADALAVEMSIPRHTRDAEWQGLRKIADEIRAWDHDSRGCAGGDNTNPMLPPMPDAVVNPSLLSFNEAWDTVETRDLPKEFEGGIIPGGGPEMAARMAGYVPGDSTDGPREGR